MDKAKLQHEIARVAYGLYEKRGRVHGCAEEDWVAAEKIVMARYAKAKDVKGDVPRTKKGLTAAPREQAARPAARTVSPKTKKPSARKKEL